MLAAYYEQKNDLIWSEKNQKLCST